MFSENKGADQMCGYRTSDLRLCFHICKKSISHNEAQIMYAFMQELITQCHVLHVSGNMGNFP